MRRTEAGALLLVFALLAGPALADEVIYFTNGTSMPVLGHTVDGDRITVDLGDGEMAFPLSQVDRIETAEGLVVEGAGAAVNQQVVRPDADRATGMAPSRHARGSWHSPRIIEKDARSTTARRPTARTDRRIPTRVGLQSSRGSTSRTRQSTSAPIGSRGTRGRAVIPDKTPTQRRRSAASLTERKR